MDLELAGTRKLTASGYEQHMMINHLSHFSLTMRLLPLLRKSAAGSPVGTRIVNVTSDLHELAQIRPRDMFLTENYSSQLAYANSKCAQVMFTRQLRALAKAPGVHVFAAHPGDVLTSIARSLPAFVVKAQSLIGPLFLLTPSQGAASSPGLTVSLTCRLAPAALNLLMC
jgi:NAD(P)-dependent dehydrogenase (short-subunit alcohol dehydrogenase family)